MKAVITIALVFQAGWLCCVLADARLGGVQIPDFPVAMTTLAAGWCVFMPLLMRLSQRLEGFSPALSSPALTGWDARV